MILPRPFPRRLAAVTLTALLSTTMALAGDAVDVDDDSADVVAPPAPPETTIRLDAIGLDANGLATSPTAPSTTAISLDRALAPAAPPPKTNAIGAAWLAMPETGHGCGEDLSFDYGLDGGMRSAFCRGLQVFSWKAFIAMAPTAPFKKGPHKGSTLNLQAERDFGRYDPAFVRWATRALIPAATDPALRQASQPIYDRQFKTLARLYFLVEKALAADPAWVERERQRYLVSMDKNGGGWDVWEITDRYHDVLGSADVDWNGNDPNQVRSATMWWLRRTHDQTRPLWADGLQLLLKTYDDLWLADQMGVKPSKLPAPASEPKTPEYQAP